MKSFVQNYRLTDSDLTKEFYWGETGSGVTGLPEVGSYPWFETGSEPTGLAYYQPTPYPVSPYYVRYEIDFIEPVGLYPIRVGPFNRIPGKTLSNTYYANLIVGNKWPTGNYQIVWKSLMGGETGVAFDESTETFSVTSGGIYNVAGITGPIVWNECIYGGTGSIGYTGMSPTPGETGTQPYSAVHVTYNTLSRYEVMSTAGEEVWITSNAPSYDSFAWARYGSVISFSQTNHGMSVGDRVILRNTNVPYQSTTVTATTVDSFSMGVANTGFLQGYAGSYSRGFNFSHVGSPKTGGVLTTAADEVKLLSIRIRTGARLSTTYALQVPATALNDASTSMGTSFIPMLSVRQDADHLSAVASTLSANQAGSYSNYLVANLGNQAASRIIILMFG